MSKIEAGSEEISLDTKIYYGLGAFGAGLTTGIFLVWTMNFYIKIIGIDPLLWALAWLFYMIWNAINDPLLGYLSDKTKTKYGRRIPFIMIGGPLLSLNFALLYFTPVNGTQTIYFMWLLITLIAYDTCFTIVGFCFRALMSELSIEPKERASINLYGAIGAGFALIISFLIPFFLIDNNAQPYSQNRPIFLMMVVVLAIIGAIFVGFTAFGIKERQELIPEENENLGLWEATKTTIKNKNFLAFAIFNFSMIYVQFAIMSNLSFYIQDVLNVSNENPLSFLPLLLFVLFTMLGLPIGMYLNEKIGGKRGVIYLSLVVIVGFIMITFTEHIVLASISFAILGLGYSGQLLISLTLLADVVDEDELETGVRREGMYFGTNALITKPAQSLAAIIAGLVFFLTGYNQDLKSGETQSNSAIFGIKLLIGIIPAIFVLIGIIVLALYYPLDGTKEEFKEMKRKVAILHEQKLGRLRKKLKGLANDK